MSRMQFRCFVIDNCLYAPSDALSLDTNLVLEILHFEDLGDT